MTKLTYSNILINTCVLFAKSLNSNTLLRLFFNSLAFRTIIFIIWLIIPSYSCIIYSSVLVYIFIIKPYIKSRGNVKVFFSHIILVFLTLTTLSLMWLALIKCFNILLAFAPQLGIFNFISLTGGLNIINCEQSSHEIVKATTVDKYESDSFKHKAPKSDSILLKIYNSVFSSNNKQVFTIDPFPIVKDAYTKTSSLGADGNNVNLSLIDNSYQKVEGGNLKSASLNLNNLTDDNYSLHSASSSSSSLDGVVIDIKVFKGIDSFNQKYFLLKDINDSSSSNLIRILENPGQANLCYDKEHVQNNNCTNHKYLSFEHKFSTSKYEKRVNKTLPSDAVSSNPLKEISFSINNEALNEIHKNSLIIESDNCNRLPVKNYTSFASGDNIPTNKWKIYIPIPDNMETINVYSQTDHPLITPNCVDCLNIN